MYFVSLATSFALDPISFRSMVSYVVSMVIAITWGWPFSAFLGLPFLFDLLVRKKFLFTFSYLVSGALVALVTVVVCITL